MLYFDVGGRRTQQQKEKQNKNEAVVQRKSVVMFAR